MFPTFSSLINYVFGTDFSWPIPTFGFFVALSFVLSYLTFRSEFVRKERLGMIQSFEVKSTFGKGEVWLVFAGYACTGFLLGYKGAFLVQNIGNFLVQPFQLLFSAKGDVLWGIILGGLFVCYIVWNYKRSNKYTGQNTTKLMSPKELMPTLLLWAAISGFIGAKLFNVFENYQVYRTHTFWDIIRFSGLTFWGGLIFGAASYLFIGMRKGIHWKHLVDIGSLGMLVAYGVGRIGCQLSGDGDWGIVNTAAKPFLWLPDWMWSFNFPHNVIHQGVYIPGCSGEFCNVLPEGVFPTSFYESTIILSIFVLLWVNRNKIKVPGMLFTIYLFVIGLERLGIEFIRVNYKYKVFGVFLSEAQIVSIGILLLGVFMLVLLFLRPSSYCRK